MRSEEYFALCGKDCKQKDHLGHVAVLVEDTLVVDLSSKQFRRGIFRIITKDQFKREWKYIEIYTHRSQVPLGVEIEGDE